jgi:hypothetical protein
LTLMTLSLAALLAACSSAPQKTVRGGSSSTATAARTFRPPPGFPEFVDHSVGREEISIQAMSLVGVPYRWGGNTPDSGFDCSGLVHYVVQRAAAVNLPRTTADMSSRGTSIEPDEIAAGDLIFFNTTGRPHSHVGIYVGKLRFVNAPSTGGTVRLDYLTNPYWAKRFDGIRRVAPPLAPSRPTPFDAPTYDASAPPPVDAEVAGAAPVGAVQAGAVQRAAAERDASSARREPLTTQRDAYAAANSRALAAAAVTARTTSAAGTSFGNGSMATADGMNAAVGAGTGPAAAAAADQFEPPPAALGAAQSQARAAGAIAPSVVTTREPGPAVPGGNTVDASAAPMPAAAGTSDRYTTQTAPARIATQSRPAAQGPDPIDAAADAFEPPPSTAALAARQAQQAQGFAPAPAPSAAPAAASTWQRPAGGVQIMRASTASPAMPAPTQSSDDPIAGFANSRY